MRDRGVLRHRVVFDTLGDGTPGGITLEDDVIVVGGPNPGFEMSEDELCGIVRSLVG